MMVGGLFDCYTHLRAYRGHTNPPTTTICLNHRLRVQHNCTCKEEKPNVRMGTGMGLLHFASGHKNQNLQFGVKYGCHLHKSAGELD